MASKKSKKKERVSFRKNHQSRARRNDLTRQFDQQTLDEDHVVGERVSGKGQLSRKRTIVADDSTAGVDDISDLPLAVDTSECLAGRVLRTQGLLSTVAAEDGTHYDCATRRLLKSLETDQRQVVVTGDRVWFRPTDGNEGLIERIESRHGVLCRASKGKQHVIVANVDQLLIVGSAAEPALKPHLIDRFLISAEQGHLKPLICINKIDLVDAAELQPLIGVFSQMGYTVVPTSATTGTGVDRLRRLLAGKETVVAGQSGVGKSSLLNTLEPELGLRVGHVSEESQKGRHTTTTARLWPMTGGGWLVDTPGIRQFALWDVVPEEVAGYFRDLRPFVNGCRFPNCTHQHEDDCAVKDAVADDLLDARRYESYLHLLHEGTA